MHNTIYLASQNKHKHKEISAIFIELGLVPPILFPDNLDVNEYGKTFEENTLIKAIAYSKKLKELNKTGLILADDSGLIIDALPNELGIQSARYKPQLSQKEKNKDIIYRLKDISIDKRTARFVSTAILYNPKNDTSIMAKGIVEGVISKDIKGINGFGYDPIFIPNKYTRSMAELPEEEKNKISHRKRSIDKILIIYNKF